MKFSFAALLLISIILCSSFADHAIAASVDCKYKCKIRCGKAGKVARCLKYCNICCRRCNCVPPGTYGNKDKCPCYRDLKNSKGKAKCP